MPIDKAACAASCIAILLLSWHVPAAAQSAIATFPARDATGVNPDTHLVLTFPAAPTPLPTDREANSA